MTYRKLSLLSAFMIIASLGYGCGNSGLRNKSKLSGNASATATTSEFKLTSTTPLYGMIRGGTKIALTGSGFITGITVTIDGQSCEKLSLISEILIQCVVPSHAAGVVSITATLPDGRFSSLSNTFQLRKYIFY